MSALQAPGTITTGSGIERGYSIKSTTTLAMGNSIGEGAYGLTIPSGTAWCQIPNGVANVNDIVHPSYRDLTKDHQIQLKCVVAGNIGLTEPLFMELELRRQVQTTCFDSPTTAAALCSMLLYSQS
jgi:hypothetical protein